MVLEKEHSIVRSMKLLGMVAGPKIVARSEDDHGRTMAKDRSYTLVQDSMKYSGYIGKFPSSCSTISGPTLTKFIDWLFSTALKFMSVQ